MLCDKEYPNNSVHIPATNVQSEPVDDVGEILLLAEKHKECVNNSEGDDDNRSGRCNFKKARTVIYLYIKLLAVVGFYVYVGFCLYHNPRRSVFVCIVAVFLGLYVLYKVRRVRSSVTRTWTKVRLIFKLKRKTSTWIRKITTVLSVLAILVFLIYDIQDQWNRYIPLGGLTFLMVISVIFSNNFRKINWTTVIWGLILQFVFGLLILRWRPGFSACKWLGEQVTTFLDYSESGSKFLFGGSYKEHYIAFKVFPSIIFFGAAINVLFYLGAMHVVIKSLAVVLNAALATTPIESFASAGSIFLGAPELALAVAPFLKELTMSEVHVVMTSGIATISGSVLPLFVAFGVSAEHLITASVMSAPAALAVAKLSYPETSVPVMKSFKELHKTQRSEANILEALSVGAVSSVKVLVCSAANMITYLATIDFVNDVLAYAGSLVNISHLSFQRICSILFMPLAASTGVPWAESGVVGALVGKKFISVTLANVDLGQLAKDESISDYSIVITTYLLCGLTSFMGMGTTLACLMSAEPARGSDFARLSIRSLINGNIACFMTACIAGLLYQPRESTNMHALLNNTTTFQDVNITDMINATTWNP